MAFTNFDTREINCKVIYFGPRSSGKTTNLRSIYANTSAEVRSGILELPPLGGSIEGSTQTQFLDFLPISLGHVKDFHVKMHLFTLPVNPLFESVTSVVLKGVDGMVFVADSQVESMPDNLDSLKKARYLLTEAGYNVSDLPTVIQYNKRDLADLIPLSILRQELNPGGVPDQEAIASQSLGTMETLQLLAKVVLTKLAAQER